MPTTTKKQLTEHELLMYALEFLYQLKDYTDSFYNGNNPVLQYTISASYLDQVHTFLRDNFGIERPITAQYNPIMDIEVDEFVPSNYTKTWVNSSYEMRIPVFTGLSVINPDARPEWETRKFKSCTFYNNGYGFVRWIRTE